MLAEAMHEEGDNEQYGELYLSFSWLLRAGLLSLLSDMDRIVNMGQAQIA